MYIQLFSFLTIMSSSDNNSDVENVSVRPVSRVPAKPRTQKRTTTKKSVKKFIESDDEATIITTEPEIVAITEPEIVAIIEPEIVEVEVKNVAEEKKLPVEEVQKPTIVNEDLEDFIDEFEALEMKLMVLDENYATSPVFIMIKNKQYARAVERMKTNLYDMSLNSLKTLIEKTETQNKAKEQKEELERLTEIKRLRNMSSTQLERQISHPVREFMDDTQSINDTESINDNADINSDENPFQKLDIIDPDSLFVNTESCDDDDDVDLTNLPKPTPRKEISYSSIRQRKNGPKSKKDPAPIENNHMVLDCEDMNNIIGKKNLDKGQMRFEKAVRDMKKLFKKAYAVYNNNPDENNKYDLIRFYQAFYAATVYIGTYKTSLEKTGNWCNRAKASNGYAKTSFYLDKPFLCGKTEAIKGLCHFCSRKFTQDTANQPVFKDYDLLAYFRFAGKANTDKNYQIISETTRDIVKVMKEVM